MSSDSPTDRELLLEILSRLRSIEESLGIAYKSDIGNPNRSGGRREEGPIVPATAAASEPSTVVRGRTPQPPQFEPQGPMPVKSKDHPTYSSEPED